MTYCNDILVQSAAINAAVNAFNRELLAAHTKTCVARDIREGKDETIDELVVTLQKLTYEIRLCTEQTVCTQQEKYGDNIQVTGMSCAACSAW